MIAGISGKYLSENASVQSLVDDASRYGYYKKSDEGDTGNPWIESLCGCTDVVKILCFLSQQNFLWWYDGTR